MSTNPHYHSYLLRLRRDGANHPWRASLQCSTTGEKFAFANILTLFAFLVQQGEVGEGEDELAAFATWLQAQIGDGTKL